MTGFIHPDIMAQLVTDRIREMYREQSAVALADTVRNLQPERIQMVLNQGLRLIKAIVRTLKKRFATIYRRIQWQEVFVVRTHRDSS